MRVGKTTTVAVKANPARILTGVRAELKKGARKKRLVIRANINKNNFTL